MSAESTADQNPMETPDETIQNLDEISEEELGRDEELSLNSQDLRKNSPTIVGIGLGVTDAWQTFSVGAIQVWQENWGFGGSIGQGHFRSRYAQSGRNYDVSLKSQSLQSAGRYYFPFGFPLYVQLGCGWVVWHAQGDLRGSTVRDDVAERLRFAGIIQGATFNQQLGLHWLWPAGVSLELSLVGVSRALIVSRSFTKSGDDARSITAKAIEQTFSWGLMNARIGYSF